jgi:SPP1 gp7 family putative phage head morphogenesis protein
MISFLSGVYFSQEKDKIDNAIAEEIIDSEISNSVDVEDKMEFYSKSLDVLSFRNDSLEDLAKLPPEEAIAWLKSQNLLKAKSYYEAVEVATAVKIDIIAKLSFYDNYQHLNDFIIESLETGESLGKAIKRLGKDELLDKIGITRKNKYYLENVIRTNQQAAINAGQRIESLESKNCEFYEYIGIEDTRQTPVCRSLTGTIKKKDDPLWETSMAPNHYMCRSRVVTITKLLADTIGIKADKRTDFESPEPGFSQDPSKTWNMPTKAMRKRLADHLGVDAKKIPKGAVFKP